MNHPGNWVLSGPMDEDIKCRFWPGGPEFLLKYMAPHNYVDGRDITFDRIFSLGFFRLTVRPILRLAAVRNDLEKVIRRAPESVFPGGQICTPRKHIFVQLLPGMAAPFRKLIKNEFPGWWRSRRPPEATWLKTII